MPTYVSLMKFTDKGIKEVKDAPERTEMAFKALEKMGGKIIDFYATMGEYDLVAIAEGPSDEVAMTFLMALAADGNVRTTTLKAFTKDEYYKLIKMVS